MMAFGALVLCILSVHESDVKDHYLNTDYEKFNPIPLKQMKIENNAFLDYDITSMVRLLTLALLSTIFVYNAHSQQSRNPILHALNTDYYSDKINWNDHAAQAQKLIHINQDGIPDIIAPEESNNTTIKSSKILLLDYNNNMIDTLNIYDYFPDIRDSLAIPLYATTDFNSDNTPDFLITYLGEYHSDDYSQVWFAGVGSYLWLSNGEPGGYDVRHIYESRIPQFGVSLLDVDQDGYIDLLTTPMQDGIYFKNVNNEQFVETTTEPLFVSEAQSRYDWDHDGKDDFVNIGALSEEITIVTSNEVIKLPFKDTGWTFTYNVEPNPTVWSHERATLIDADKDGDADIVFGGFYTDGDGKNVYEQKFFRNDVGEFVYLPGYIEHNSTIQGALKTWVSDIDGDGDLDLYYPTYSGYELANDMVFWWENTGTGFRINKNYHLPYLEIYPQPVIVASQVDGVAPQTIRFASRITSDPKRQYLDLSWSLGDGNVRTSQASPPDFEGESFEHTFTAAGDYTVVLTAFDGLLTGTDSLTVSIASGVDTESLELPETFVLKSAYPNPFNPTTTVTYGLPAASEVRITATDLLGRQVATLVAGDMMSAGYYTVQLNADGLASGTYLIRMEAGDFVATQQVVLLK